MNDQEEDLLADSVDEVTGNKDKGRKGGFMLRFRASGLLAVWFLIQAFQAAGCRQWLTTAFDIIVALCLIASYSNRPIRLGPIEFGGW